MQFLQKHPSKFTQVVMFGLLLFIASLQAMAQKPILPSVPTTCDYTSAPATITLTVGTEPSGFSKNYLLVNMVSGAIVATNSASPSFTNIPQGLYYATTAYYTSGAAIHNDVVGKLISEVYVDGLVGGCLKYAPSVGIKVCTATCDFNTAPATIAFTATPSSTAGVTTTYALVDEATNKIIQTSTGASFTAVPVGDFSVVGVYSTGTFSLAVGDTLYAKTTNDVNCVGVSNTIHYKVCSTVCLAGTTAPIIPSTATNTCPVATVNFTGLDTGTKPAGTTLIWSTHKVPTSAGDTLTNLTTVSTVGKYYALYFDKVNNCYSPADSVTATITVCLAITQPTAQTAAINEMKTGNAVTDLVPTGGTGALTYSNGSADPACVQPLGTTALTVSINANGTYSYTAPATPGTYYFCVKVCDSTSPTADCKVGIYTVVVTAPCLVGSAMPSFKN